MRSVLSLGCGLVLVGVVLSWSLAEEKSNTVTFNSRLSSYLSQRLGEFGQISTDRQNELRQIAEFVREELDAGRPAKLVFICTHNSRRSHLSQIWASVAASYYAIPGIETFSGGTAATAFNPRAIAALERAGVRVEKTNDDKNPKYLVHGADGVAPTVAFSKRYDDEANPQAGFCAVMTCSEADEACPNVAGAKLRVPLHYADPKVADGKPEEAAKYDERCAQISREMLYLFSQVGK
jgi:protein-tyrosine-phosphatase